MKTLRPLAAFVITAVSILTGPNVVRAAEPISMSETQSDAQVSGTLPNSRAGLMTLGSLSGLNEVTIGALPSVGFSGNFGDNYWRQDFYTVDAFLPWNLNPGTDYFFGEIGLSITEQGQAAGNLGVGYAYYLANLDRLMRMSSYLTIDGQYEKTRAAWSLRGESLGKYVDVLSGIQIVTTDSDDIVGTGFTGVEGFSGNKYLLQGIQVRETAFHNADIEIGGPLPYLGDYGISAYAKGYYMLNTQNDLDSLGFGFRSEWSITEDVTFNVNYTKDDIFDHSSWFNITMATPDGAPRNFLRPISTRERFSKRVHRTGRIPTKVTETYSSIAATNAKGGGALDFLWVDPNRATDGNGTFENPYNNLESARLANSAATDVILVTPDTTNLDPGENLVLTDTLQLFDNQYLLSTSVDHTIPTGNVGDLFFAGTGGNGALISNESTIPDSVVTLANWNTVSGFIIDGRDENGDIIHNGITGSGISGFDINRNTIQNVVNGTLITHMGSDIGYFNDNIVTGGGNNSTRGFSITHTGGTLALSAQRNNISGFLGEDVDADGMLDPGEDLNMNGQLDFGIGLEIIANGGTINAWDPNVFGQPVPLPPEMLDEKEFGILDNVSNSNGTGMLIQANNGATVNADIQGNQFSNNVNPETGARLESIGGTLNVLAFNENLVTNNIGNGLIFRADDNGGGPGTINIFDMNNNTITGNGFNTMENPEGTNNNGIFMVADNASVINAHTGLMGLGFDGMGLTDNNISNNAGGGLLALVDNGSILRLDFEEGETGNVVNNNGRDGLFFQIENGSLVSANIFNGEFSNNSGFGIGAELLSGSALTANIGSYGAGTGNTVFNNQRAGIGFAAFETSTIFNTNIINNVVQSTNASQIPLDRFGGDGVAILVDESTLVDTVIDLNIIGELDTPALGNIGNGIRIETTGSSASGIQNLVIGNLDGDNNNGNQIGNNAGDGIHIERSVASLIPASLQIVDNKIWNNNSDGIEIISRGSDNAVSFFNIEDNQIFTNASNGINLQLQSDAQMNVDIINNVIDGNSSNGILTSENVNAAEDMRFISGTWDSNLIINNGGNGINNNALLNNLVVSANLIEQNGLNGILHNSAGTAFYVGNRVLSNGVNSVTGANHGIDIQGQQFKQVGLQNNLVDNNDGDGLEVRFNDAGIDDGFSPGFFLFSLNDVFSNNGERGIDILNQGEADSFIQFDSARVVNNQLEGVYVVNTASTTQGQNAAAGAALDSNGSIDADVQLNFAFTNGTVEGNGVGSGFNSTGLLIRVGTSEIAAQNFASNTFSGVVANIDNNIMQGNQGHDFYVDAFVSTVNPPTNRANVDPLARLDLNFTNNTGDSINVDASNFAVFYDNADAGKSPWDITRRRNATRLSDDDFIWFGAVNDTMADLDDFDVDDQFMPGFFNGADDSFNGRDLTFTSGPNAGATRTITDSTAAGNFTFGVPWLAVAGNNNQFFVDFTGTFYPGLGESTFRFFDDGNSNNFTSGLGGFNTFGDIRPGAANRQGEENSEWDEVFAPF
ncbi:MAG: hypothetical protein HUJ26_06015 [Planctomycetaceae bacterium]|nr:hypothetical protein [Planctomycetaceae bacterium]